MGRPGPPLRRSAEQPRRRPGRRRGLPRQEPPGLRRGDPGRGVHRRRPRDRQLALGRRRGRLRRQRLGRLGALRRRGAGRGRRRHPRQAHRRAARGEGDPRRRRGRRVRSAARRVRPGRGRVVRRLRGRHVPGDVLLRHHRAPQGRDAHQRQHDRPHLQRPRGLGVRGRRQVAGGDAAVPRRRVVLHPLQHLRRHPQRHDPRPRRPLAGVGDHERRQLRLPGARGPGAGAGQRRRRGQALRRAEDLHLRRRPDAERAAARGDGGLAEHEVHAGLRPHRGLRRHHPPAPRGPPRHRAPRAADVGRHRDPRGGGAGGRPRDRQGRPDRASPGSCGSRPRS